MNHFSLVGTAAAVGAPLVLAAVLAALVGAYAFGLAIVAGIARSPRLGDAAAMTAFSGAVIFGLGLVATGIGGAP